MKNSSSNEVIQFIDDEFILEVQVSPEENTVWLTRKQISELFDRDVKTIGKHVNNVLKEEINGDDAVVAKIATTASDGKTYEVDHYNLDVIIGEVIVLKANEEFNFVNGQIRC